MRSTQLECPILWGLEIEDEHFAVSESVIETARAQHSGGNWLHDSHRGFQDTHGKMIETQQEEDDVELTRDCQSFLCPGLCKQQLQAPATANRYYQLCEAMKNLLRIARGWRRTKGWVPDHIAVLRCTECSEGDISEIKHVQLMSRVSFSPFDATLVKFQTKGPLTAELAVDGGQPVQHVPLAKLLFEYSHNALQGPCSENCQIPSDLFK